MSEAKVTILGCGSAKPTKTTSPSAQLVDIGDKRFLVDCGEGVILTMQKLGIKTGRLYNIGSTSILRRTRIPERSR